MKQLIVIIILLAFISCKQKYNKEIWVKNANQKPDNPRFDMVEDLRKNHLLKGISSNQVFDLLDNAENIDTTKYGIHWSYSIGSNSGFHIDPFYLIINFDSTGKLIDTEVNSQYF